MITSSHQNVIQNQNIVIGNLSFENVEKFRYLGVTLTNTNDTREEIKLRINMGNACYYSLEKILSFENVEKLKYLGVTVTYRNNIREEIKRRINMRNAC